MEKIAGKTVIVTGASSGIGHATALLLAKHGAHVVLAARREERLKKLEAEIKSINPEAKILSQKTDVTKREAVEKLITKTLKQFDRIDVLVNNAGIMSVAPMNLLKVDEWEQMIDLNVKGLLYCIAAVLPIFNRQNSGHFINISSIAGLRVSPGSTVYGGTKFAVRAISEGLRKEVGGNIRTTVICPGAVQSELSEGTSVPEIKERLRHAREIAIPADAIARSIIYAMQQPKDVDINEIVIRPTIQES